MKQSQPFLSIIIPTYNRPKQLAKCLQSLTRLDYPSNHFEVIIVDDGSEISLESVVAPFRKQINLIPSRKVPANFKWAYGLHKLFQDTEWWNPDDSVAADFIRYVIKYCNTTKGASVQSRITKTYSWRNATMHLLQILSELQNQT